MTEVSKEQSVQTFTQVSLQGACAWLYTSIQAQREHADSA